MPQLSTFACVLVWPDLASCIRLPMHARRRGADRRLCGARLRAARAAAGGAAAAPCGGHSSLQALQLSLHNIMPLSCSCSCPAPAS